MLLNLIAGCDSLIAFLTQMASRVCFDGPGLNDIFHLKAQSATFLRS